MIVGGLRSALDSAGHRSVQRPSAAALGAWVSEPLQGAARQIDRQQSAMFMPDFSRPPGASFQPSVWDRRSEEHTSELPSLMRISYAVFCLHKKTKPPDHI